MKTSGEWAVTRGGVSVEKSLSSTPTPESSLVRIGGSSEEEKREDKTAVAESTVHVLALLTEEVPGDKE